jgi:hypothetical protein
MASECGLAERCVVPVSLLRDLQGSVTNPPQRMEENDSIPGLMSVNEIVVTCCEMVCHEGQVQ